MIRLIATDLDGTLLTPEGRLPEGTFDRIRRLKAQGITFVPASGRQFGNLQRLFYPVRQDISFICENGAYIVADGQGVSSPLPAQAAREIMQDLLDQGMELLVSVPESTCMRAAADKAFTDDVFYRLRNTATIVDDPLMLAGSCIKISGYHPTAVPALAEVMKKKWQSRVKVAIAGDVWLDFTMTSKGQGLEAMARALGVPLAETAAFGDQYNDLSMLEIVGHPFLMEHAPSGLQGRGFAPCRDVTRVLDEILAGRIG